MKLGKREKNSIIIVLCFHILVFFILIYSLFFYFYPKIKEIENKKVELQKLYNDKMLVEKSGISYNEFINLNKNTTDSYFKNIINNVDAEFYNNNFINNGELKFNDFIVNLAKSINSGESQEKLLSETKKISKILPSYTEDPILNETNLFTNFRFINYLESILSTFNLTTKDNIGISNIELLTDYQKLNGKDNNLEANLFSIPIKLTVEGKKEGIINFLYFARYVGNIKVDDDISIYSDDFLKTKYGNIILKGDNYNPKSNYNIYENQIFDIDYIKFVDYIDSSAELRGNLDFINFIKSNQGNETYKIEIKLNFYTKGIQQFQLTAYINSILDKYFDLNTKVTQKLKSNIINKYDVLNYKKANDYLTKINPEIINIKKEMQKASNLEQIYSKITKYNLPLLQIEKLIQ